jgi:hypothetical protein
MRRLLAASILSLAFIGGALAQSGIGQIPALNVVGNPTGSTAAPGAFPIFSTANAWSATQTITAPALTNALVTSHALSGTIGGSVESCVSVCINVNSDTVASGLGVNAEVINYSFGGSTVTGARTGLLIQVTQTAPANGSNPFPAYVGIAPVMLVNAGAATSIDTYFGANPQVRSAAAGARQLTGQETDVWGTSVATQQIQLGHSVEGLFVNHGSTIEAAFAFYMGASSPYGAASAPGPGWNCGFCAGEFGNSYVPLSSTGTFVGTIYSNLTTIPIGIGIDLRGFVTATADIFGRNWNVTGGGQISGTSLVSNGGSVTVGINASNTASLALANGGVGGAFAVIKNPSTTVTYNFNLPATAGSAGNVLASGGGAAAPMTWITGVTTVCTVTAGNSYTFTNGVLTTKGANCT